MALPFLLRPEIFVKLEGHLVIVIFKFYAKIHRFQLEISQKIQKSDYTDYQTITRIRNILKLEKNLCNHFLKSVKSRECAVAFQSSHENDLTKPSISIPYMQQNSSIGDSVV
jgi:hypothetical protein